VAYSKGFSRYSSDEKEENHGKASVMKICASARTEYNSKELPFELTCSLTAVKAQVSITIELTDIDMVDTAHNRSFVT
jgi:hypothetical protein